MRINIIEITGMGSKYRNLKLHQLQEADLHPTPKTLSWNERRTGMLADRKNEVGKYEVLFLIDLYTSPSVN